MVLVFQRVFILVCVQNKPIKKHLTLDSAAHLGFSSLTLTGLKSNLLVVVTLKVTFFYFCIL